MDKYIPIRVHPHGDSPSAYALQDTAAQIHEPEPQAAAYSHERVATTAFDFGSITATLSF